MKLMRIPAMLFVTILATTNVHAQEYIHTSDGQDLTGDDVLALFEAENFDRLEYVVADLRTTKAHYSGGAWALHFFYGYAPANAAALEGETEKAFLDKIERWKASHPDSVTWRVFLARTYERIAWRHRGSTFANEVSEEQWSGFSEYLLKAWKAVIEAEELPTVDPEIYSIAYEIVLGLGPLAGDYLESEGKSTFGYSNDDTPDMLHERVFNAGVAVEPLYYDLYYKRVRSLELRWGAKRGELEHFLIESVERTKSLIGEAIYARLFWYVKSNLGSVRAKTYYDWDWERVEQGHEDTILQFPDSKFWPQHFCYSACLFEKREKAQELFAKNPTYYASVWKKKTAFGLWRKWILRGGVFPFGGALEASINDNNAEGLVYLLENGADPERRNAMGYSMLYLALYYKQWECAKALLDADADLFRSQCARQTVIDESEEILQFLLDNGFDLSSTNEAQWNILHYAAAGASANMVRRLVEEGLDVNAAAAAGNTPLIIAARRGDKECVKALIELGADVSKKTGGGNTAEDIAIRKEFVEIAEILRQAAER